MILIGLIGITLLSSNGSKSSDNEWINLDENLWDDNLTYSNVNNIVPKNIFQIWDDELLPSMHRIIKDIKAKHPDYNYYICTNEQCKEFIKNYYPQDVFDAYNKLKPAAYKSDLFRYCILNTLGGVYLDVKYELVGDFNFSNLLNNYYVRDIPNSDGGIYNAFMVSKPNNIFLQKAINRIVENCKNKYYGYSSLEPTGPLLLKHLEDSTTKESIIFYLTNHDGREAILDMRNSTIIMKAYKNYRKEQMDYYKNKKVQRYNIMWKNNNIYEN